MRGEMNHHGMRGWPRMGVGWSLMISCARATRTLRMCSFDARSGRPSRPPSREEKRRQASLEGSIRWMTVTRCAQLRAALATPSKRGGENWKNLARIKACLG